MRPSDIQIHPEGFVFAFFSAIGTLLLWWLFYPLGVVGLLITLWILWFFRNPPRVTPQTAGAIISPADGVVCAISPKVSAPEATGLSGKDWTRVCIFMDVVDVHINRMPINGKVIHNSHKAGKFFDARLDKSSEENEQQILVIEEKNKKCTLPFVQIAGLLARRIRCDVDLEDKVVAGQRFGLIRFGSRVDVYLPKGVTPQVIKGQTTVAGETILGNYLSDQPPVQGISS
ncbi:phosphatidylserine decarboxylase family protein [Alphaproteobacteria bacterium]|nr:phosphatidylserine decarboxylase family protein [Alphaproteobacteria bacterium]